MVKIVYLKISQTVIYIIVILTIFIVLPEAKGEIRLSYRVAQLVCESTVKFARNNQINGRPSQSSFVSKDDIPCRTIKWKKCEPNTDSSCHKFKHQECSVQSGKIQTKPQIEKNDHERMLRIVNGTEAKPNELPYIIWMAEHYDNRLFCGGAIFNENFVVTAAHCVTDGFGLNFYVVAGDHDHSQNDGTEQRRNVTQKIEHEHYDSATHEHDIALLKIDRPFEFSENVFPPSFPELDYDATGQMGIVAGWGATASLGNASNVLLKVSLPIISYEDCKGHFASGKANNNFLNVAVCTLYPVGGRSPCHGDSGGPLVVRLGSNCDLFVGITSYSIGCAIPKFPTVYTHVASHMEWIKSNAV